MKKIGIILLVFFLGFFCLLMNSLIDVVEKESMIEVSGLIYLEKLMEFGIDLSIDFGIGLSVGFDIGLIVDFVIDFGKSIGGDMLGIFGFSDIKGNLF